ncbi:hypothetical protein ACIOKD_40535 [Streptomyces sp. NPDC087844]|uniref:hypothetical protein n=1 Tax=Streptomyces sp. NPDC087844 TaxID=3365805 RepID=UPI0038120452
MTAASTVVVADGRAVILVIGTGDGIWFRTGSGDRWADPEPLGGSIVSAERRAPSTRPTDGS